MSYPTKDDANYTYEPPPWVCPLCYPVGKSPHRVLLAFSGIAIGDLWVPGDEPPGNGTYFADAIAACQWRTVHGDLTPAYSTAGAQTFCWLDSTASGRMFRGSIVAPCISLMSNTQINPAAEKYYGGQCMLLTTMREGDYPFIDILDEVALEAATNLYGKAIPIDADIAVHRFSQRIGKTNIKIKYDHS